MRIIVDRKRCEANAVCVDVAPQMFSLDERDHLRVRDPGTKDRAAQAAAHKAVRLCPRHALRIDERPVPAGSEDSRSTEATLSDGHSSAEGR